MKPARPLCRSDFPGPCGMALAAAGGLALYAFGFALGKALQWLLG